MVMAIVASQSVWAVDWPPKAAWDDQVTEDHKKALVREDNGDHYTFHIKTNWDLAVFGYYFRITSNATEKKKLSKSVVLLEADIDMRDYQWRPMGEVSGTQFGGTFDGQGHSISYLYNDRNFSGSYYQGMFDILNGATIKNVVFKNCHTFEEGDRGEVGIVAGGVENSGSTFENLEFYNCYINARRNAGLVVGSVRTGGNVFKNILVHYCYFRKRGNSPWNFGGLIGLCFGSTDVSDCYLSIRPASDSTFPVSVGGVIGSAESDPNINIKNCVIDVQGGFFNEQNHSALVGFYNQGHSHVTAKNVLVASNQDIGPWWTCGLFTSNKSGNPFVQINDCFVRKDWGDYAKTSGDYRYTSKNMNSDGMRDFVNIYENWDVSSRQNIYLSVLDMNRKGASFTIRPESTNHNYCVRPVYAGSMGKIVGFDGKSLISSVTPSAISGSKLIEKANCMPSSKNFAILCDNNIFTYTAKSDDKKWIVADNTSNMSGKERTGAWTFKGRPTKDGKFDFDIVERPLISFTQTTTNQTKRQVTLKWKVSNDNSKFNSKWKDKGEWHIYRNNVDYATVANDVNTWTDVNPPVGTQTTYEVYFVSNALYYKKTNNINVPSYSTTLTEKPDISAETPDLQNGCVINTMNMPNAELYNDCEISLLKWDGMSDEDGKYNSTAKIIANAKNIYTVKFHNDADKEDDYLTVSYTENGYQPSLCSAYRYMWVVRKIPGTNFAGKVYNTEELSLAPADSVQITSMSATKGWSTNGVTVKWQVNNKKNVPVHYVVYRTEYVANDTSKPEDNWDAVYEEQTSKSSFSYEDKVLPGYVYRYCVRAYPLCEGTASKYNYQDTKEDIGFAASRGTIMGTINYKGGSGTTEGVDVRLVPEEGTLGQDIASYAMMFQGKPGEHMPLASGLDRSFWDGDWTLQCLINPNDNQKGAVLMNMPGRFTATLSNNIIYVKRGISQIEINTNTYTGNYVILQHLQDPSGYRLGVVKTDETDGTCSIEWSMPNIDYLSGNVPDNEVLYFGNSNSTSSNAFEGQVDEIRLWKGLLSDDAIATTYNSYLSGNEKNLMAYYNFDSGVTEMACDISHPLGKWNNRNTMMPKVCPVITSDFVPSDKVLTYRGKTNNLGEYVIAGVPYTGEGTYYNIIPQKGAHQFQPAMMKTYVSERNLVREKADFTDVSSYKVSGIVYYDNTNVPVDEVYIKVDGNTVLVDGELAVTDKNGAFCIDVPIGEHVISVEKNGHTFVQKNYPGTGKVDIVNDIRDLVFWDATMVKFAGRVAGGNLEKHKPLGVGASQNNIGTAEITLSSNYMLNAHREQTGQFTANTEGLTYETNANLISSTATAQGGNNDACHRIVITTDALTGEFSAMLPPVEYKVESIRIPSNPDVKITDYEQIIYPSNVMSEITDSIMNDEGDWTTFTYNTKYNVAYYSQPVFEVEDITSYDNAEDNSDEPRKAFGERYYTLLNNDATSENIALFEEKEGGQIDYKYKHPVFFTFGNYRLKFKGYENYENKENPEQSQIVPMQDTNVEISNGFSISNAFMQEDGSLASVQEDGITLDSEGTAIYQFQCGAPSLMASEDYARTMDVTFVVNGVNRYAWPNEGTHAIEGVVFGQIPMGNDIITAGPDVVNMVLRDPPGTASSATWKKGATHTFSHSYKYVNGLQDAMTLTHKLGVENATITGAPGAMIYTSAKSKDDMSNKLQNYEMWANSDGYTIKTTNSTDISTSTDKRFDGPDADLFIGMSTNIVFGKALDLHPHYKEGRLVLETRDMNTVGEDFGTTFAYSQHDIIATVIPKLKSERDNLLLYDDRYTSNVSSDSPDFGKKGTYTWTPRGATLSQDSVAWYNTQIERWEAELALNEMVKVNAIQNAQDPKNYTFTSSSSITESRGTTLSEWEGEGYDWMITEDFINKFGITINDFGVTTEVSVGYKHTGTTDDKTTDEDSESFSFTLKETGSNDIISVSVLDAPDGSSPIFYTRGGQTSAMWEPQQVTKYYKPGTEIMARTMKIMVPKIRVENPVINNIPAGETAIFNVSLCNESETQASETYVLKMDDRSNTNGAIVTSGGAPLITEISESIKYGTPTKVVVTLQQSDLEKLDHRVAIILADPDQKAPMAGWPANADTVYIEAHFVPASSEVKLSVDSTYINTKSDGKVTAKLSGYDLNRKNMMQMGLQYKSVNDQEWTTAKIWNTLSACTTPEDSLAAVTSAETEYSLDMSNNMNYPEGTYYLRAYTMSQFADKKVYNYSPEVSVMKDFTAPKVMGTPQPANGTYNFDSEISISFNEDIRTDKIMADSAQYVTLMGRLNVGSGEHSMSMLFDGGKGAETEAQVAMPVGSVTIQTWMKWKGGAGEIISQSTENGRIAMEIDADGHLVLASKDTIVSTVPLLKDKWIHLSTTVDCTDAKNHKVTASYAYGDKKVYLFRDETFHKGNGEIANIVIGKGFRGNMYDMTVWDYPVEDEKAHIYNMPKNQFTTFLGAYWPMIEGLGKVATDMVAKRNLVLPDNVTWSSASENYAMRIEKEQVAYIDLNNVSTNNDDDYLVQMWFRKDKTMSAEDNGVMAWNSGKTAVGISGEDGTMYLRNTASGSSIRFTDYDVRDGKWHHFSLMVHKAKNGYANIYLDGQEVGVTPAKDVSNLQGNLVIGGNFDGYIDEIRVRNWDYTAAMIQNSMLSRYDSINARQIALNMYFPFEKVEYDEFNQPVTTFCTHDIGIKNCGKLRLIIPHTDANPDREMEPVGTTEIAPVLIEVPRLQRLNYTLACDKRNITLKIREDENPALYQGCTLYASIYDVEDMAGNKAGEFSWAFTVDMNYIDWASRTYDLEVTAGQINNNVAETSFAIKNMTGLDQSWTIEGVPSWMQINNGVHSGRLSPNETANVTVTFTDAMPIGTNHGALYLVDSRGISHQLLYNVTRIVNKPEWSVNPHAFKNSMNIIGQVVIDGVIQSNTKSVLAAFDKNDNCIGVCSPEYNSRYGSYFCFMTVYGNESDMTNQVRFRYFDVSTSKTHPSFVQSEPVYFKPNAVYGSIDVPFKWTSDGREEMILALEDGWNWVSVNVKTDSTKIAYIISEENADSFNEIVNCDNMLRRENGKWVGELTDIVAGTTYKMNVTKPSKLIFVGTPAADLREPITIGNGWNWLGANVSGSMPLEDAMADMSPQEGDIIKSQTLMATYADGGWVGNLRSLNAGYGYFYYSTDPTAKAFTYPTASVVVKNNAAARSHGKAKNLNADGTPDYSDYSGTMTVIAAVEDKGVRISECKVIASDDEGNIRALKASHDEDEQHLLYLVIHGDEDTPVTFSVIVGHGENAKTYTTSQTLKFVDGKSLGSSTDPYIINLDVAVGIESVKADPTNRRRLKVLEDGRVVIIVNDHKYSTVGYEVE